METALERDSVCFPALEVLVKLYARGGKAQEAVRRLSALTSQHPKNAGLQFLLGLSYFSLKDLQKAEASARQTVALDAQTPVAHSLLAAIDQAKGLKEQAMTDLRRKLKRIHIKFRIIWHWQTCMERKGNGKTREACSKRRTLWIPVPRP